MTRQYDVAIHPEQRAYKDGTASKNVSGANRPSVAYRKRMSKKMAILFMAFGYLGLVVILASTPIWSQALLPDQSSHAACIDAGGSR